MFKGLIIERAKYRGTQVRKRSCAEMFKCIIVQTGLQTMVFDDRSLEALHKIALPTDSD